MKNLEVIIIVVFAFMFGCIIGNVLCDDCPECPLIEETRDKLEQGCEVVVKEVCNVTKNVEFDIVLSNGSVIG